MGKPKYSKLAGTSHESFQIGGPLGPNVKKDGSNAALKDAQGVNNINLAVKDALLDDHAATLRDVKRTANVMIEFHFDGENPPAAGANTGCFGMCGKTGGSYNAGEIVYDSGTALSKINVYKGQTITTGVAVSGAGYTVSLVDNGFYAAESAVAPFNWVLKGDGTPSDTGSTRKLKIDIAQATVSSTTAIPVGAVIEETELVIETPYSTGASIKVEVDGVAKTELLGINDNYPQAANIYAAEPNERIADADHAGVVKVTISGNPTEGSGFVIVNYCGAFLS